MAFHCFLHSNFRRLRDWLYHMMTKLYTPFGHWCDCVVSVSVFLGLGFFFSEHCSVMGLCFCVYSISICFIKSCLNLGVNFLEEVCVLFSCVKHVSWAYQDTDGTSRKPKPTRQKHWFVYHHTSIHTHTQNNLGNQLQGANFFAPKSLEQWRWLNSTVILLRLCLRKFLVLEKLEKESCFRSWEPGWLTMNSFVWTA